MTKKEALSIILTEVKEWTQHLESDPLYDELRQAIKVLS